MDVGPSIEAGTRPPSPQGPPHTPELPEPSMPA